MRGKGRISEGKKKFSLCRLLVARKLRYLNGCFPVKDLIKTVYVGGFNNINNKTQIIADVDMNFCLFKCFEDITCNYVLMCSSPIKQCFLLSGDIDEQHSTDAEYDDCYKMNIERCYNCGIYFNNICQCIGNYTSDKCQCNSGNLWSLILSVLSNSSVDYGTGQELYNSVNAGNGLKVSIINGNPEYTTIYSIEHSGASVSNNIWAITIENVKLNHLNTTDSFLARHRLEISSAQPYASEWSMTFNDRKESVVYFENFAIKWFQENKIGSSPCLEMKNGNVIIGSMTNCLKDINKGADMYLNEEKRTNTKATSVLSTATYLIFLDDFNLIEGIMIRRMVSTSGLIVSVSHILEQTSTNISTIETGGTRWYVESRQTWEKILTFDGSRDVVYGSKDQVYDAAVNGSGFRIVIEHSESVYRYAPIDIVHVYNTTFVVLETGIISSIEFDGDEYRSFQWDGFLSTNGVYETVKWTTGSDLLQCRTIVNYNRLDVFIQN
ncbi:hypothetical protein LOTGIDRAFT_153928 [Lottia gigantea]|uniref:Uncharacterized protein n=1 Tax=Lottia gigantea TaxID=225164 RepID=V4A8W2_LOTGI|nr:hypothetical protein LOTGIDRAFT_153928 [Lottia gigantea]ESO91485.1 hypothetical protein LOTGIDRAFT_153928 [Lottia gigantea]